MPSYPTSTVHKVGIKADAIKYIVAHSKLTSAQVKAIFQQVLERTLSDTKFELTQWINSKVPKRTGQLRESLLRELNSSRVTGTILYLVIGAMVPYATQVNAYTTSNVRHLGTMYEHSGKKAYANYGGHHGPIYLDDPRAVGQFWDKLMTFIKERLFINLAKAKYEIAGGQGITSRHYSKLVEM